MENTICPFPDEDRLVARKALHDKAVAAGKVIAGAQVVSLGVSFTTCIVSGGSLCAPAFALYSIAAKALMAANIADTAVLVGIEFGSNAVRSIYPNPTSVALTVGTSVDLSIAGIAGPRFDSLLDATEAAVAEAVATIVVDVLLSRCCKIISS